MKMGQTKSTKVDVHKYNELLEVLKEYRPTAVEHMSPVEAMDMVDMHEIKKTKAD